MGDGRGDVPHKASFIFLHEACGGFFSVCVSGTAIHHSTAAAALL